MSEVKVEDKRNFGFYMIDNIVMLKYGADIGPYGLAIYNVLCLHASRDGKSHPSYDTLARLTGMSKRQAMREIDKLVDLKLIAKTTSKDGKTNTYQILDVKPSDTQSQKPQPVTDSHPPSDSESLPLVTVSHPNNTHKNNTQEQHPKEQKDCPADAERSLTPWQEFMGALCWVCYGHDQVKALTKEQTGQLTSEAKKIKDLGFDIDDLRTWYKEVWRIGWQVDKNSSSRPVPSQVRTSLPSIRADTPDGFDDESEPPQQPSNRRMSKIDNNMLAIDQAFAYLEKHGVNPL